MIQVTVPGYGEIALAHLVCDYNGTLAVGGKPVPGVPAALNALAAKLTVHVVTADTFGVARAALVGVTCTLTILPPVDQAAAKAAYVRELGAAQTAALGNGRNDRLMLQEAALGIAVQLEEGTAVETILAADILCPGILPALALFDDPRRLVATLRG